MAFQSQTAKPTERRNPSSLQRRDQVHSFLPFETNMKSAVQLIALLACVFLCTSGNPIMRCQCIKTIPAVRRHLIAYVRVDEPSPICSKQVVIAFMKDKNQRCLDPKSDFTKRLLQDKEILILRTTTEKLSTKTRTTATAAAARSAATSTSVTRQ